MVTKSIDRVEDVREGDLVTITRNGTTVVGTLRVVRHGNHARLDIAGLPCSLIVAAGCWTFVRATREVPDLPELPTEPGSVIVNATIRGVPGQTAILCDGGAWFTTVSVEGYLFHDPEHITAWEPGRIVPEGGAA